MGIDKANRERLFVACHRRCCVCHRYCGVRMEIHHIVQKADRGADTYDNVIAVCFDCHAEINHYNPRHPKGRRFTPDELKAHRKQWLSYCAKNPAALASSVPPAEGGALERLLNELMFNEYLTGLCRTAAVFEVGQFRRAIGDGTFGWLKADQASEVYAAYALISEINNRAEGLTSVEDKGRQNELSNEISSLQPKARVAIETALKALRGE